MLQVRVGVPENLRNEVHGYVKWDLSDPRFAFVGLVEGGRISGLPQQEPDGCHCGAAGAKVDAQVCAGPLRTRLESGQLTIY